MSNIRRKRLGQAEKAGTSWKGKLKIAVVSLILQVSDFEELLARLQAAGYEVKRGKYISCRASEQERFTRLKTLGVENDMRRKVPESKDFYEVSLCSNTIVST